MATRKRVTRPAKAKKCPDCGGKGETTETVRVGSRRGRETSDRQSALCLSCWGTGAAD